MGAPFPGSVHPFRQGVHHHRYRRFSATVMAGGRSFIRVCAHRMMCSPTRSPADTRIRAYSSSVEAKPFVMSTLRTAVLNRRVLRQRMEASSRVLDDLAVRWRFLLFISSLYPHPVSTSSSCHIVLFQPLKIHLLRPCTRKHIVYRQRVLYYTLGYHDSVQPPRAFRTRPRRHVLC
jgi:hypothetical protein